MRRIRILLADDHAMFRESIRYVLQRHPEVQVIGEACDGKEAVRLTDEHSPDVVLMDIAMPNVSGLEATRMIKARHPDIDVLVLTTHEEDEYLMELVRSGASGYVLKKASREELIEAVRTVNVGGLVVSRAMGKALLHDASRRPSERHHKLDVLHLTPRETQVLELAATGMSNQQIATELGIGVATVKGYLVNVFDKMGVKSRTEAALQALSQGLIDFEETP